MAVTDLWISARTSEPTKRYGIGMRYRVSVEGHPSKSFRVKAAAKAHEAKLLTQGPTRPASEVTVGEMLALWREGKRHLSKSGQGVASAAASRVRDRWGDVMVDQVYSHEVQAWVSSLTVERGGEIVPASRDTAAKALGCLRGSLAIAMEKGLILSQPCDGVKLRRAQRRDARFLTVAEVRKLAAKAGEHEAMVWLLATTGVRVGECCALTVGDVDAGRARLRVRKSKNGRPRDVPVPASTLARLDLTRPRPEPLFVTARGKRVQVANWRHRVFAPAAEASGLPDLHVHDLRHTAASLMIASGASPKDVQRALGHKSAAMTLDLYAGHWDEALDGVSARMDGLLQ